MDSPAIVTALHMLADSAFSSDSPERQVCIAAAAKVDAQASKITVLETMLNVSQQELLDEQNKGIR